MNNETLAVKLPVLPIKRTVLFPGIMMPLTVGRERSIAAVEAAMKTEDKTILVVAQRDPLTEEPGLEELYTIGTKAIVKQVGRSEDGTIHALVQGLERVALLKVEQSKPFLFVQARRLDGPADQGTEVQALHRAIQGLVTDLPRLIQAPGIQEAAAAFSNEDNPVALAYRVASLLNLTVQDEQKLLESSSTIELLRSLYGSLSKEIQILQLRDKITSEAQAKIGKTQREYVLREQLKAIQEELGEGEGEENEITELKKQIQEADLPDHVRKEVEREVARLAKVPPSSPDHQVLRTYLELVLELPWKKASEDRLELSKVRQVLEEDHYGIKEVKERIVEHLAVLKLNPTAKAPILCLVGPPGVGKTSLGQSIARAMGRTFERFSLGGVHDEAELRGHRRTYVGALPGRIIQAMRRANVNNPVLMLDEVDKMGRDFRGDPAAALLEVLDPAQNHTFRDHYLDLPFDLSKVFFITTANTLDTVSQPLLDRMEIIRLQGYSEREKAEIARRYLWPRRLKEAGLDASQALLSDDVLNLVISRYTREAGVRQLEQMLGRLTRKVALTFAELPEGQERTPVSIQPTVLPDWLGSERFMPEEARKAITCWRGHGARLDSEWRGCPLYRNHAAPRQPRADDHRSVGRRHAGVCQGCAKLPLVARGKHGTRYFPFQTERGPHPCAVRSHPQRWPFGRDHDGHGSCVFVHRGSSAERHGHDRRDQPERISPSGRRDQGKGVGRSSRRHQTCDSAQVQREGLERGAARSARGSDLHPGGTNRGGPPRCLQP